MTQDHRSQRGVSQVKGNGLSVVARSDETHQLTGMGDGWERLTAESADKDGRVEWNHRNS